MSNGPSFDKFMDSFTQELIDTPDADILAVPQGYRAVSIKALVKIASLIDPEPVEVDGKRMVFKNPIAAEVLTRLSAEIRKLLADAPAFRLVGKADFHMSAELDVCIGDDLYIRGAPLWK